LIGYKAAAMVFHAAELIAVWIQAAQQNPVVNCPASEQESWVKWLLPTIVQTVISLAAIGSGVWIAHWSFVKNRDQEQKQWERNQKATHDQWLRDQKKNEWSNLLRCIADVQRILIPSDETPEHNAEQIARELHPAIREMWIAAESCVFTKEFLEKDENRKRFNLYLGKASQCVITDPAQMSETFC
jgi:hypothetical protein